MGLSEYMNFEEFGVRDVELVVVVEEAGGAKGESSEVGAKVGWDAGRRVAKMLKDRLKRRVGGEMKDNALSEDGRDGGATLAVVNE